MTFYDENGQPLSVGDEIAGSTTGTIRVSGPCGLRGTITAIDEKTGWITVRKENGDKDQVGVQYDHKSQMHLLAGEAGTWERGFYKWGMKITKKAEAQ